MWWLVYKTANPVTSVQLLCRERKGSSSWSLPIWTRGWILHKQNHQWGKSQDHHCTFVAETKMHGSRPCKCKMHKRSLGTRGTNYPKRAKCNSSKKDKGHIKTQNEVSNKANSSMKKGSNPFTKALAQQPRGQLKHNQIRSQLTQTPVWNVVTLITDRDFLVRLATFNVRTVTELDISHWDAWHNQKQSTKLTFGKKWTPWMPGKPKVMQTPSTSARYKSNKRHSRRTPKGSASTCMLTCHSQPGTTTKNGLSFMPVSTQVLMSILCLCPCTSA